MIEWMTLLLTCQLAGEALSAWARLPVPGPVCGMVFLFVGLVVKGRLPQGLADTADALLSNLSLLFVPAGVGIMLHFGLLGREWLPLSLALVLSTLITIAITALLMSYLSKLGAKSEKGGAQ